jgi:hypothetical protein
MKNISIKRTLEGAFWLIMGTGMARILPIFVGMLLAHQFDASTYSSYVAFVVGCNLIVAVPLMGTTQLMLSQRGSMSAAGLFRQYVRPHMQLHLVCWALVATLTLRLVEAGSSQVTLINVVSLYVFSLGYCLTGVAAAAFNKVGLRAGAGLCWIISTTSSSVACLLAAYVHFTAPLVVAFLAFGWLVGGLLCAIRAGYRREEIAVHTVAPSAPLPSLRQLVAFGAPSVVFLLGFYLLTQQALHSGEPYLQGAFSLGYQLFSAALFLPGVMGNITTPRLVRLKAASKQFTRFVLQLLLLYAASAFIWFGLIYLAMPWLLAAFQLPRASDTTGLLLWLQAAAAVATFQALLNQLMAAERMSLQVLFSACTWLLVILLFLSHAQQVVQIAGHALVAAYLACLVYSTVAWWHLRRSGSGHENN